MHLTGDTFTLALQSNISRLLSPGFSLMLTSVSDMARHAPGTEYRHVLPYGTRVRTALNDADSVVAITVLLAQDFKTSYSTCTSMDPLYSMVLGECLSCDALRGAGCRLLELLRVK